MYDTYRATCKKWQLCPREDVKNGNVDKIRRCKKNKKCIFSLDFEKTKKHGALRNLILDGSMFFSIFSFFRPSLKFSETLSPSLLYCHISVIHIWKAYDPYFSLHCGALGAISRFFFSNSKFFLPVIRTHCVSIHTKFQLYSIQIEWVIKYFVFF